MEAPGRKNGIGMLCYSFFGHLFVLEEELIWVWYGGHVLVMVQETPFAHEEKCQPRDFDQTMTFCLNYESCHKLPESRKANQDTNIR